MQRMHSEHLFWCHLRHIRVAAAVTCHPQDLFERPSFIITLVPDVVGAEMCGTLKNIVALAAGFVEGMGYGKWLGRSACWFNYS